MGSWARIILLCLAVFGVLAMTFNFRLGVSRTSWHSSTEGELVSPAVKEAIEALSSRVCGSPAIDGYAHVVPACLESSPTNTYWKKWVASGGTPDQLVVHIERNADYDGLAVGWGIGNTKATVEECAEACRNHKPGPHVGGPYQNLPCNVFSFCGLPDSNGKCFEPDIHSHTKGDCWLKFSEGPMSPEVNFRGKLSADYLKRHPKRA
eukprot:jgi/Botrbrau1/9467/Bobra.0252s0088.1